MRIYLKSPKAAEHASLCCKTKDRTVPEIQRVLEDE